MVEKKSTASEISLQHIQALRLPEEPFPPGSKLQEQYGYLCQYLRTIRDDKSINNFLSGKIGSAVSYLKAHWGDVPQETLPANPNDVRLWLDWLTHKEELRPNDRALLRYLLSVAQIEESSSIDSLKTLSPGLLSLSDLRVSPPKITDTNLSPQADLALVFSVPPASGDKFSQRKYFLAVSIRREEDGVIAPPTDAPDFSFNRASFFDTASDGAPKTLCPFKQDAFDAIPTEEWKPDELADWPSFFAGIESRWQKVFDIPLQEAPPQLWGTSTGNVRVEILDLSAAKPEALQEVFHRLIALREDRLPPLIKTALDGSAPAQATLSAAPRDRFLGHMDEEGKDHQRVGFSLDPQQRLAAMLAATRAEETCAGSLLAVNGPPGTGKTAFLRAVLASLWVTDAEQGSAHPKVVVATAATNKAVTNVIEAFSGIAGTDPTDRLTSRWLPGLPSYGWFFPSKSAAENYPHLMHLLNQDRALVGGAASEFQQSSTHDAEGLVAHYLGEARNYFPAGVVSLEDAVALLRQSIQDKTHKLRAEQSEFSRVIVQLQETKANLGSTARIGDIQRHALAQTQAAVLSQELSESKNRFDNALIALQDWNVAHRKMSGWRIWIPGMLRRRLFAYDIDILDASRRGAEQALSALQLPPPSSAGEIPSLFTRLKGQVASIESRLAEALRQHKQAKLFETDAITRRGQYRRVLTSLLSSIETTPQPGCESALRSALKVCRAHHAAGSALDHLWHRFDSRQDREYRFRLFHLAARYWEGRWLQAIRDPDCKLSDLEKWAMLGVVFVSTTHKVPALLKDDQADLLVMDESGQCLSVTGFAMLSFARNALVVGDTRQLQPISSISSEERSFELAEKAGIDRTNFPSAFCAKRGSMMLIAQSCTSFNDGVDEPGITLQNHYRCQPDIIGFCNVLLYGGKITPVRKPHAPRSAFLPPMAWVDVRGEVKNVGASKTNPAEAQEICRWLKSEHPRLCALYGDKPLADVVAILTPYKAQANLIKQLLASDFGNETVAPMTIGTVDSLQGAQKPIVAFSLVSAPLAGGTPVFAEMDGGNRLNVAVSRAQDSFVLFSDRSVLALSPLDKPRLAAHSPASSHPIAKLAEWMRLHGTRLYPRALVIIEAGGKRKRMEKSLGLMVQVIATQGSFRSLRDVKDGRLEWEDDKPADQIRLELAPHKGLLNELVIATDDDLAGELIGFHAANLAATCLGQGITVSRMRFHSTEQNEICTAFKARGDRFDANMLRAAMVREVSRWHDKRHFHAQLPHMPYVSAQRRAMVTLIDQTRRERSWVVRVAFDGDSQFQGVLLSGFSALAPAAVFRSKEEAQAAADVIHGMPVIEGRDLTVTQSPPLYPPNTTFRVLQMASDELGIPPWEAQAHLNAFYMEGVRDD